MRSLACCHRNKEMSLDFDEQDRVRTYTGLEGCMLNGYAYDNESAGSNNCTTTDSLDEEVSSCSSSKDPLSSSFSSQCPLNKRQEDEHGLDEWEATSGSQHLHAKEKVPMYTMRLSDIETMKERFAKLLLGEDVSGGCRGATTALALSHAITNLAASVFGELWKLEPLSEEKKSRWRREMDWFLSPTNYMVELVPAKQSGANGRMLEIMTPKARADVDMNLPALKKLDSMLIDVLDSMVDTEFWYAEGGSRAEGRSRGNGIRQTKKWWLPSPRVPESGLSLPQRKKLGFHGKLVHQVLKAANSINEDALVQIHVPAIISGALPKSGKASLGENVYRAITLESKSVEEMLHSLQLKSEHHVLEVVNQLEGACYAWKQKISEGIARRSPIRNSWAFVRDFGSELDRIEMLLQRAQELLRLLKSRFLNLPQTFLDATKVQYNKDIGLSIIEAYSRVLGNLAFSILSRIGDILQEDDLQKPSTPVATLKFDFSSDVYLAGITETPPGHIRRSLLDQMNMIDGRYCNPNENEVPEEKFLDNKAKISTMAALSPYRNINWCYGREA